MRCKECGIEVDNEKAFCPICGAPMKVTADYEYIQAEIANKVDRFFNDDTDNEKDIDSEELELGLFIDDHKNEPQIERKQKSNKSVNKKSSSDNFDEFAKTRNLYDSDSIFDDDSINDEVYEEPRNIRPQRPDPRNEVPRRRPDSRRRPLNDDYYEPKSQTAAKVLTVLIIFIIIGACAVGVMAITGAFKNKDGSGSIIQSVSSLTSNVVAGETYDDPVEIVLSNPMEGNIFYTLDGTEPSIDSKMYTGPFVITAADVPRTYPTVKLRAVSFSPTSEKSGDLNIEFKFVYDESMAPTVEEVKETVRTNLENPQIIPESGVYSNDMSITVLSPDGVDIYYTYDGSMPTASSTKYTGPVKMIPGMSVFSAICVDGVLSSSVAKAEYELNYGYDTSPDGAILAVKNELLYDGYIADYDGNTYDGGHADIKHLGVYEINGYTYYIIEADIFSADNILSDTLLFGVGVNYGSVYWADRNGDSFVIN